MNKSNNNNSRPSLGSQPKSAAPRNPVQGRGRGPRPQQSRSPGQPQLGSSMVRPARKQAAAAAAYATGQSQRAPIIQASRDQSRIVHRELIGSMTGSAAFAVAQTIPLNPGMATFAPWLASQASSWERYRFNKLRFCYFTRTGSNVPGSMMLVPDYDAADAAPLTEQVASSYEDVEEDAPWKDIVCVCKPSSLHALGPSKFIRSAALAPNLDIKTYDAGTLFACTTDGTAVSWGKLWVEYDVTLLTPQLNPAGAGFALAEHFIGSGAASSVNLIGANVTNLAAGSTILATVAGEVVTFPAAGEYLVVYQEIGTTDTQSVTPVVSAGSSILTSNAGPGANQFFVAGSASATFAQIGIVKMLAGGTLTFNNAVVGGGNSDLYVVLLPSLA